MGSTFRVDGRRGSLRPRPDDGKALPPRGSAPMIVVLAQEERINAIERRLVHVTDVLRGMGVDA